MWFSGLLEWGHALETFALANVQERSHLDWDNANALTMPQMLLSILAVSSKGETDICIEFWTLCPFVDLKSHGSLFYGDWSKVAVTPHCQSRLASKLSSSFGFLLPQ